MRGTAKVFGVVIGLAGLAVTAMIIIPKTMSQAGTGDPTADGGGWAHAGAPPPAKGLKAQAQAQGATAAAAPADYPITGIDISSHDHSNFPIGWSTVAAGGGKFVYIKATEGLSYTNPYFAEDFQAARDAGLMVGAYAFARPDVGNPTGQADYLVDNGLWQADTKTMVPMLDLEWPYGSLTSLGSCWGLTTSAMSTWIRAFVTEVEAKIGRPPMIYTNPNWWNPCTGNDATFGDDPLDVAAYGSTPPTTLPAGWSTFTLWQYAAGASNVANVYDRDVYNGDANGLATLAGAAVPTAVSLRAHYNGQFVTAESAGAKPLISARGVVGQWETFDLVDVGNGYIGLRSHANGRYVTADVAGTAPLIANRLSAGDWERFLVVHNADGSVSLKANVNGRYVTGIGQLMANRTAIGPWEEFDEVTKPTVVSLRARVNNLYVTPEAAGTKSLIANRSVIGAWEVFDLYNLGNNTVALLAHVNTKWVTAEGAGSKPLIANRPAIGPWETFQLIHNADGSISLRANADNAYVTAENAGAAPLIANRSTIGAWERFDLIGG